MVGFMVNKIVQQTSNDYSTGATCGGMTNGTKETSSNGSTAIASNGMRRMKAEAMMAPMIYPPVDPRRELGKADFRQPNIDASNMKISHRGAYYNNLYGNSWLLNYRGYSTLTAQMDIAKHESTTYSLDLVHLASLVGGQLQSKITITVNGQTVASGHNPNSGSYKLEKFDITQFVKNGSNEIQISLDGNAVSNYWIQSLAVVERARFVIM